jgi:uncharacterized membrane protein
MLLEWITKDLITGHAGITGHCINKGVKALRLCTGKIWKYITKLYKMENTPEIRKIEIEEDTLKDLNTTRKWSMFISIIGFIMVGLVVVIGFVAGIFLQVFKTRNSGIGIPESMIILILLVFAVVYFFPILYLYRFSKHAGNAVRALDKTEMQKAFKNLRRYYVFIGILLIIVLLVYFIALIAMGASMSFLKDLGTGI